MESETPLQVEARVDAGGPPQPLAFRWRGRRYRIRSIGRTWLDAGEHHYLVMAAAPGDSTPGAVERVYELAFATEAGSWRMVRQPDDFGPPGRRSAA